MIRLTPVEVLIGVTGIIFAAIAIGMIHGWW